MQDLTEIKYDMILYECVVFFIKCSGRTTTRTKLFRVSRKLVNTVEAIIRRKPNALRKRCYGPDTDSSGYRAKP